MSRTLFEAVAKTWRLSWATLLIGSSAWAEQPEPSDEPTIYVKGMPPAATSASRSVVTSRDIEAVPLRSADDALRLVPGLVLVQHGSEGKGQQYFLRGFDALHGSDLEVSLDGIPLNEWSNVHSHGYLDLGFIVPEVISRIEVTKGPFEVDQSAFAMAGSARYYLGVPEQDRGLRTSYLTSTTNRQRGVVTFTPREGDGRDFFALEALHDDGYGQNRQVARASALGRVDLFDSPTTGRLSLLSSAYLASFQLAGLLRNGDVDAGRVGFFDSYDRAGRGRSGRGLLGLFYEQRQARRLVQASAYVGLRHLDLTENFTGFLLDPDDGDRRGQTEERLSFGVSLSETRSLGKQLALHLGGGMRGESLDQEQTHLDQATQPLEAERALQALQVLTSAFASLRYRPTQNLSVEAGARADLVEVATRNEREPAASGAGAMPLVSPRLGAQLRVSDALRLHASYGRGFRPPEARAFSSVTPDVTGISEEVYRGGQPSMASSDALEIGAQFRPAPAFGATLSGFGTFIAREIVFDHVSGLNLELSRTKRLGVELDLRVHPTPWLLLVADATLVEARFVDSGRPIPFAPWLVAGARAVVTHESGFRAGLRFLTLAPRALPHGATGAPLARLDLSLGYHFKRYRIDGAIENVLGQPLREGEYHFASAWNPDEEPSQIPVLHTAAGPPINARLSFTALF